MSLIHKTFPRVRVRVRYILFSFVWTLLLRYMFLQSYDIEYIKAIQDAEEHAYNAVPALTENMKSTERSDYSEVKNLRVGVTPEPTPSPTNRPTPGPTSGLHLKRFKPFPSRVNHAAVRPSVPFKNGPFGI